MPKHPKISEDLKAMQDVVEAAREYREKNKGYLMQWPGARKLLDALTALDTPPEGKKP